MEVHQFCFMAQSKMCEPWHDLKAARENRMDETKIGYMVFYDPDPFKHFLKCACEIAQVVMLVRFAVDADRYEVGLFQHFLCTVGAQQHGVGSNRIKIAKRMRMRQQSLKRTI